MDLGSVVPEFEAEYSRLVVDGMKSRRPIACVGLARNCAEALERNLTQVATFCDYLHIETNDNDDGTTGVLVEFCDDNPWASYRETFNGRPQLTSEFAGPRTRALAEYRTACQEWARTKTDCQYIIVADFDAQGGFDVAGVFHGLAWLDAHPALVQALPAGVRLPPASELALIGENFGELKFQAELLRDLNKGVGVSGYFRAQKV